MSIQHICVTETVHHMFDMYQANKENVVADSGNWFGSSVSCTGSLISRGSYTRSSTRRYRIDPIKYTNTSSCLMMMLLLCVRSCRVIFVVKRKHTREKPVRTRENGARRCGVGHRPENNPAQHRDDTHASKHGAHTKCVCRAGLFEGTCRPVGNAHIVIVGQRQKKKPCGINNKHSWHRITRPRAINIARVQWPSRNQLSANGWSNMHARTQMESQTRLISKAEAAQHNVTMVSQQRQHSLVANVTCTCNTMAWARIEAVLNRL